MFTLKYREDVREAVLQRARQDERIVSAAIIGSYAKGTVDRWSDLDLTFGVDEKHLIKDVLNDWTEYVRTKFNGIDLVDLSRGNTIYRVFLLPGNLQMDLSFSPEKEFGALNKEFVLLYGKQYDKPQPQNQTVENLFGWIIHHLIRTRYCVERNRLWQAEFWLSEARDYMLKIACLERGLNADHGRGFDDLPEEIIVYANESYIKEVRREEMLLSIKRIIAALPKVLVGSKELLKKYNTVLIEILVN